MASNAAKTGICSDKKGLSDNLVESVHVLTGLQNEQTKDLIKGGSGLPRIELAIKSARARWEKAKQVYVAHLREHGC